MKGKGFLYIPQYALVYARIPKCANTSIKSRLAELISATAAPHPTLPIALQPTNDRFWKRCTTEAKWLKPDRFTALHDTVTSFTVIRDPLQRLRSCYREKICRAKIFPPMRRLGYRNGMDFNAFVELTCSLDVCDMGVHTQPQTFLISDSQGRLPNFIGTLENLAADWANFSQGMVKQGIPLGGPLDCLNSSKQQGRSDPAPEPLSPQTQRMFDLTYGADIKLHARMTAHPI